MAVREAIKLSGVEGIEKETSQKHIPSKVQADTLFTFTGRLEWIIDPLRFKMISPRFCVEDIGYLKIRGMNKIAIPMRCFCDINFHRLGEHLNWYGYYGLAFSKEWGMRKKIQPINYINPESELCKDFTSAFTAALKDKNENQSETQLKLQNYLLHQAMYCKPYSGNFTNRRTGKKSIKCFTDECEWRFVPDVSVEGFEQIYFDKKIIEQQKKGADSGLSVLNKAIEGLSSVSLAFEYSDIKYIIVNTMEDLQKITTEIEKFEIDDMEKHALIAKIIVWDHSKEDF